MKSGRGLVVEAGDLKLILKNLLNYVTLCLSKVTQIFTDRTD